jgi:poly(3-hydroxybutyrate) depolymerase
MKKFILILAFISSNAFANDVALTWEKSWVFAPWRTTRMAVPEIKTDKVWPVVVYLHGCSGIAPGHGMRWGEHLSKMGFITILPDSYARPNRQSNCNSTQRQVGFNPRVHDWRQEEITYAIEQLMKSSWVDKENIFLFGHSEGGFAVSQSRHKEPKGNIISGWTCTGFRPGVHSPKNIPVLAVAWNEDPWFYRTKEQGRCIDSSWGRNITQVDLDGPFHDTVFSQTARLAVYQFLKKHTTGHKIVSSEPIIVVGSTLDEAVEELVEFK